MIEFYKSCNTSVFVTFLDASKAYDKIDHWLLYDKLLHNDVPVFIVKILVYWYSHQEMFIRWGNSCSNKFYVANGVKQGGILSPALFNVYMNNLSVTLNQSGIGGFLGDSLVNHICYADDCICRIAQHNFQSDENQVVVLQYEAGKCPPTNISKWRKGINCRAREASWELCGNRYC